MIIRTASAINKFFFEEVSPASMAIFRMAVGILTFVAAMLLAPDLTPWFGPDAVVPVKVVEQWFGGPRFSVINMFPQSKEVVLATWLVLVWASATLTFGWHTRISALCIFLALTSFHHRDPFTINTGDTILRLCAFFLIFSPAGKMYSIDSENSHDPSPTAPIWVQRLIQLQLTGIYAQAFFCKAIGQSWQDGTALYWVLKLEDYARFPLPFVLDHMWLINVLTWGTLLAEFALLVLIWVKPARYYVLAAGIVMHLGIEYAMNIPVFEWITMAMYLAFVDPKDTERAVNSIRLRLAQIPLVGRAVRVPAAPTPAVVQQVSEQRQ